MVKSIAAASVLALAGSAVAAPFTLIGADITGESQGTFGTGAFIGFVAPGGVFWNATLSSSPAAAEIPTATLIGAHPEVAPPGDPDSATLVGAVPVVTVDPLTAGDNFFRSAFTFPSTNIVAERVWLGQYFSSAPFTISAELNTDGGIAVAISANSDGTPGDTFVDPATGQPLELVLEDRGDGGFNAFVQVVPAPGAVALMGLAGVAGLRRRRA